MLNSLNIAKTRNKVLNRLSSVSCDFGRTEVPQILREDQTAISRLLAYLTGLVYTKTVLFFSFDSVGLSLTPSRSPLELNLRA